jgi:hypothetical protein
MTDKHRHPRTSAPRGTVPNWVLVAFMASAAAIAITWRVLV